MPWEITYADAEPYLTGFKVECPYCNSEIFLHQGVEIQCTCGLTWEMEIVAVGKKEMRDEGIHFRTESCNP